MRVIRIAGVCVLAAIVIVSASREPTPNPLTPRAYLDRALALIQANALDAPALDWVAVTQHAHQLAADAKTPEDTYPAIEYALSELSQAGDLHARFIDPVTAKLGGGAAKRSPATQAPAVTLAHKRLGQITLPGLLSLPGSRAARRYVAAAVSGIASLDKRSHPCGWIVDLRGDTGGNAYSMLLAIGPIIGEGRLLGLTGRKGFAYWIDSQTAPSSSSESTTSSTGTASPTNTQSRPTHTSSGSRPSRSPRTGSSPARPAAGTHESPGKGRFFASPPSARSRRTTISISQSARTTFWRVFPRQRRGDRPVLAAGAACSSY
jgi:hypothetical protein